MEAYWRFLKSQSNTIPISKDPSSRPFIRIQFPPRESIGGIGRHGSCRRKQWEPALHSIGQTHHTIHVG